MFKSHRKSFLAAVVVIAAACALCPRSLLPQTTDEGWDLIWREEFDGEAHAPPDPTKWIHEVGDGGKNRGWGNHELQTYSKSTANVFQDGRGNLVIRALKAGHVYTSGRIKTQGKFAFMYGRVDARIKIPYARGIWPAFWMLGDSYPGTPWPSSGEIDIMECFGSARGPVAFNRGTLHGPGYAGTGVTRDYSLPGGLGIDAEFHVFSVEWEADRLRLFVDNHQYLEATPGDLPPRASWVFNDAKFFLLLNLAVGGSPAPVGDPDESTVFPQDMVVDYVRVYQRRR